MTTVQAKGQIQDDIDNRLPAIIERINVIDNANPNPAGNPLPISVARNVEALQAALTALENDENLPQVE